METAGQRRHGLTRVSRGDGHDCMDDHPVLSVPVVLTDQTIDPATVQFVLRRGTDEIAAVESFCQHHGLSEGQQTKLTEFVRQNVLLEGNFPHIPVTVGLASSADEVWMLLCSMAAVLPRRRCGNMILVCRGFELAPVDQQQLILRLAFEYALSYDPLALRVSLRLAREKRVMIRASI